MIDEKGRDFRKSLADEKELWQLYSANYSAAERYILQNNGTREHAKDIYQEAFIAVWRNIKLGKFMPEHEHALRSYLMRVVKNKWIDHLRSAQHKKVTALNDRHEDEREEPQTPEWEDKLDLIREHFRKLGDVCRDILIRFYYKKEPLKLVAEQFGWTEATARNNKYRCVERLRTALKIK